MRYLTITPIGLAHYGVLQWRRLEKAPLWNSGSLEDYWGWWFLDRAGGCADLGSLCFLSADSNEIEKFWLNTLLEKGYLRDLTPTEICLYRLQGKL